MEVNPPRSHLPKPNPTRPASPKWLKRCWKTVDSAKQKSQRSAEACVNRSAPALQHLVLDRSSTPHSTPAPETLRLSKLMDQDDIEAYLLTFERIMQAHHIYPAQWVFRLALQLTGKAQQAYAALSTDESGKYEVSLRKAKLPQSLRHASRISPKGGRRSVLQWMSYSGRLRQGFRNERVRRVITLRHCKTTRNCARSRTEPDFCVVASE